MKALRLPAHRERVQAEQGPQQGVIVRQVLQAVPVGIESESHDPQDQDPPQFHAGAAGGFFVRDNLLLQEREDLRAHGRVGPDPLQGCENGREFIAAAGGDDDFLDGEDTEFGIDLISDAHGGNY